MPDPTSNYSWNVPNVGADSGAWGELLNGVIDDIDAQLFSVSGVATAALPKSGGVMSGLLDAHTTTIKKVTKGGVSGPVTLDLSAGGAFTATIGGVTTFTFANTPQTADSAYGFLLRLTDGGSSTVTWPATVQWAANVEPSLTSSGVDLLVFVTFDLGATWIGAMSVQNAA